MIKEEEMGAMWMQKENIYKICKLPVDISFNLSTRTFIYNKQGEICDKKAWKLRQVWWYK